VPGAFNSINYAKTDLWAAGTIAYEMYGLQNPFSGHDNKLHSQSYLEEELPALPDEMPTALKALIVAILSRNPSKVCFYFQQ
jgi:PTEN induced putative kinase 1